MLKLKKPDTALIVSKTKDVVQKLGRRNLAVILSVLVIGGAVWLNVALFTSGGGDKGGSAGWEESRAGCWACLLLCSCLAPHAALVLPEALPPRGRVFCQGQWGSNVLPEGVCLWRGQRPPPREGSAGHWHDAGEGSRAWS